MFNSYVTNYPGGSKHADLYHIFSGKKHQQHLNHDKHQLRTRSLNQQNMDFNVDWTWLNQERRGFTRCGNGTKRWHFTSNIAWRVWPRHENLGQRGTWTARSNFTKDIRGLGSCMIKNCPQFSQSHTQNHAYIYIYIFVYAVCIYIYICVHTVYIYSLLCI